MARRAGLNVSVEHHGPGYRSEATIYVHDDARQVRRFVEEVRCNFNSYEASIDNLR